MTPSCPGFPHFQGNGHLCGRPGAHSEFPVNPTWMFTSQLYLACQVQPVAVQEISRFHECFLFFLVFLIS